MFACKVEKVNQNMGESKNFETEIIKAVKCYLGMYK